MSSFTVLMRISLVIFLYVETLKHTHACQWSDAELMQKST